MRAKQVLAALILVPALAGVLIALAIFAWPFFLGMLVVAVFIRLLQLVNRWRRKA